MTRRRLSGYPRRSPWLAFILLGIDRFFWVRRADFALRERFPLARAGFKGADSEVVATRSGLQRGLAFYPNFYDALHFAQLGFGLKPSPRVRAVAWLRGIVWLSASVGLLAIDPAPWQPTLSTRWLLGAALLFISLFASGFVSLLLQRGFNLTMAHVDVGATWKAPVVVRRAPLDPDKPPGVL